MTPIARRKYAELASAAGAGVLGAGLGALLGELARPYALGLIVIGIGLHGLAMVEKRRLEAGEAIPLWSTVLYWICWTALAGLLAWIGIAFVRA